MNSTLSLNLSADLLPSIRMTLDEVRVGDFQVCLAVHLIGPHYDAYDALRDAATLAKLRSNS
ncbi:MAG: hypothetical protein NTX35_07410 [Verrucomicrobia bacterium]|jgi:hypothetical protein|nr:hypothetical protein [Verrucomicrobiota bacterium]